MSGGYLQYSPLNQYDYSNRFSTAANQCYNVDTNGQNVTWTAGLTSSGGSLSKMARDADTCAPYYSYNSYNGPTNIGGGTLQLGTTRRWAQAASSATETTARRSPTTAC